MRLDGCPVEEVRAGFLKKNEGMEILDARPLGKSKAIQITFGGSRNCKFRLVRKPPTGRQQSIERENQAGKDERHSRAKERSSSDKGLGLPPLLIQTQRLAASAQLIVVGDFNAPHPEWGYIRASPKGNRLWQVARDLRWTLLNNPQDHTRIGNSISTDTSPDLTFLKDISNAKWVNTGQKLGSDHYILSTTFSASKHKDKVKGHKVTDWDRFRKTRADTVNGEIEDLDAWVEALKQDVKSTTVEVPIEEEEFTADSRLLHMWEAHVSLLNRWKMQKHSGVLRRRMAKLERQIETYTLDLKCKQWGHICDRMNAQFGCKKTWQLLRHLLDPAATKSAQRGQITRLEHQYQGTIREFIQELRDRYITKGVDGCLPHYSGTENSELDEDFTVAEVEFAMGQLRTTSAAGPDGVTNKMLRNLDFKSVGPLTDLMNKYWAGGEIPAQWEHARIIFIPKPGKKLCVENLHPISLTSCVGKLMEHVVLNRLQGYAEDKAIFPATMIGFRANLSTQNVILRLKHDVVDPGNGTGTKAKLGLDLNKAFDNVSHEAILKNLSDVSPGARTFRYIRSFLESRTAEIAVGEIKSDSLPMGGKGTPQGSVLSPFLFNLALIKIPPRLEEIPGLKHTFYADDITLWVTRGSDAHLEETLQQAVNIVEELAGDAGLSCSQPKSELFVVRDKPRGPHARHYIPPPPLEVKVGGMPVAEAQTIRILGLYLQTNRKNTVAFEKLKNTVNATVRLIRRIANRKSGIKEKNLCKLVQAFVLSRITYATTYMKLGTTEKGKVEAMIRQDYKAALGLPNNASTDRLLRIGVHNTLEEVREAHLVMQHARLSTMETGRDMLERIGVGAEAPAGDTKTQVRRELHKALYIKPLPKNMHPIHHEGRRKARARNLHVPYGEYKSAVYTDVAEYKDKDAFAIVVVDRRGRLVASGSVKTRSSETAEEAAIALAITNSQSDLILSDSKTAIRNLARGRISVTAARLLHRAAGREIREIEIVWVPAHSGNTGNEVAHLNARGFVSRAEDFAGAWFENVEI
ncbi:uncharacterized protein LOC119395057 [Rhipicephalus sanguineus]|uniref:uncharacterized protein LOC119395057 n=1 Tax=Rhipicephalus sanguineus TaxID=34632 RepID=UPI001893FA40|nr:uncharacterized protein LOC119395057 [Rhipicephalus sanguineus]